MQHGYTKNILTSYENFQISHSSCGRKKLSYENFKAREYRLFDSLLLSISCCVCVWTRIYPTNDYFWHLHSFIFRLHRLATHLLDSLVDRFPQQLYHFITVSESAFHHLKGNYKNDNNVIIHWHIIDFSILLWYNNKECRMVL